MITNFKIFEKLFGLFTEKLKKYIIIKDKRNIIHLYLIDNYTYKCKLLGYYNLDSKELQIFTKEDILKMNVNLPIIKAIDFSDEFLYQTDELQDAINYLSILADTEKYNL